MRVLDQILIAVSSLRWIFLHGFAWTVGGFLGKKGRMREGGIGYVCRSFLAWLVAALQIMSISPSTIAQRAGNFGIHRVMA